MSKSDALLASIRRGDLAAVKTAVDAEPKLAMGVARGQSPLYVAIQNGKTEIVSYLLDKGANPNAENGVQSLLSMALSIYNDTWKPIAQALLDKGAKIDRLDIEGQTPLLRSVTYKYGNNQKDKVAWLLAHGADVYLRNSSGKSALEVAIANSSTDIAKVLLEKTDVKRADEAGNPPLFAAVAGGNIELVHLLLDKGADINAQNDMGDTVLHLAARNPGSMLKQLLDAGAKTNLKNNRGDLPIHIALRRNSYIYASRPYSTAYTVREINARSTPDESATPRGTLIAPLTAQSDPNVRDHLGFSPLLLALLARDQESRDLLMGLNPKMDATTRLYDAVAQGDVNGLQTLLTQKPFLVYSRLPDGTTPLHVAALWGALGVARLLVQKGADVNASDAHGQTPLHEALTRPTGLFARRAQNMTVFLLEKNADANALDQSDASPLHYATKAGDATLMAALLAKNANANARDSAGQTPIFLLMTDNSELNLVKMLLDKGAKVNVRPQNRVPLLSLAVGTRRKDLVQLLLNKGADLNAKSAEGRTALSAAFYQGSEDDSVAMIALLLDKGADPNEKIYNDSLLGRAISSGYNTLVKTLLATKKVNLSATLERQSPLMQAVLSNRPEIVQMLLDAGADPNETDARGRSMTEIATEQSKVMGNMVKAQIAKTN